MLHVSQDEYYGNHMALNTGITKILVGLRPGASSAVGIIHRML